MNLSIDTPIIDLHLHSVAKLGSKVSRDLAIAIASYSERSDPADATIQDLLNYFPMRYEDRSTFLGIDHLYDGLEASVEIYANVAGGYQVGKNRGSKQPPLFIFEVAGSDRTRSRKPVVVWWFISGKQAKNIIEYYSKRFERGTRFIAHGKWEWDARRNTFGLKVTKPDEIEILPSEESDNLFTDASATEGTLPSEKEIKLEASDEDTSDPDLATVHTARRVPIYRKLGRFQTKRLREIIFDVLQKSDLTLIKDDLPAALMKRQDLIKRRDAIRQIHFPPDDSTIVDYEAFRSKAQIRLIFDEFFWLSFALQLKRGDRAARPKSAIINITEPIKQRIGKLLTFKLTGAQKRVVKQIFDDMSSNKQMNRLIQGDVGSGKTIVAFIAMFAAAENGYQAAIMAPTEILAEQHFRKAVDFFKGSSYSVALLTGGMKASEKRKSREAIKKGDAEIVIGTHAIIQDDMEFSSLGLAVIDEQHRFGVLQRSQLMKLGNDPDILAMTATPIPRSLAMTVYGDLDVSIIDELPPGRTPVKTVVVGEDKRSGVYKGIDREISKGRQVYVVYPLIEESEKLDLKAATKMFEELRDDIFPLRRVGLMHGKLKPDEKEKIMDQFASGNMDILVSTTVIEVGVDVPNASVMIIEHAERFGLSQLHQLRGRIGRGSEESFCVLLTGDKKTAVARERLGIMEETSDGFKIAEKDLELRGEGEILGTRQSGIQLFKIANIVRDVDILEKAKNEAEYYLNSGRKTAEAEELVKKVTADRKFKLADIG